MIDNAEIITTKVTQLKALVSFIGEAYLYGARGLDEETAILTQMAIDTANEVYEMVTE